MVDSDESIYSSNEIRKRMRLSFLNTPHYWGNILSTFKIVPNLLLNAYAAPWIALYVSRGLSTISELRLYKSEGRTLGGSLLKLYFLRNKISR